MTHMDVGNTGFAGAEACPCGADISDLIRDILDQFHFETIY